MTDQPPPEHLILLLAAPGSTGSLAASLAWLAGEGARADVVESRGQALAAFFASGGHHLLALGPGVAPGIAWGTAEALSSVDPALHVAVFGRALARHEGCGGAAAPAQVHVVADLHPGARAGAGALLRILRAAAATRP